MSNTDTICALATAVGNASVAVIRLSGDSSLSIAQQITKINLKPRYAHLTSFYDVDDQIIDQGLVIYFPAPWSFTGEEIVELHPHGSPYVCQLIIQQLINYGARHALAGEFSERAFINGKLDLTQLEAIADLISSGSQQAARSAVKSMQGNFSKKINHLLEQLIQIRTHIEASLDFAEEEIETETREAVESQLASLTKQIVELFDIAQRGAQLQKGYTVVLTGSPNVGKSSLFNALCEQSRAIVTSIPGTTRDVLSADIQIDGAPIRLLDTAGIREHADPVEQQGIERAQTALDSADVIIQLLDATMTGKDHQFESMTARQLLVVNKCDLIDHRIDFPPHVIGVSAKTGEGILGLRKRIQQILHSAPEQYEAPFSARTRHLEALQRCLEHCQSAQEQLGASNPVELAAEECRLAQQCLSEITGEFTADDLLDYVFREFCIGK